MKIKKAFIMGIAFIMVLSNFSIYAFADEEKVVLSILDYNTESVFRAAMEEIQQSYMELHPNIEFEYVNIDSSEIIATYVNRLQAGDAPDLYQGKPRTMQEFIDAGYLLDLSEYDFYDNIHPDIAAEMEVDGKMYGVPFDGQVKGVFYNERIFEENGISVPTTYDEFIELCDMFMEQGTHPFSIPLYGTSGVYHFIDVIATPMAYVRDNGSIYADAQDGTVPLGENENAKEMFKILSKLVTYKEEDDGNQRVLEAVQEFALGENPMMITGGFSMCEILAAAEAAGIGDTFGFFPFPWSNDPEENRLWFGADDVFVISAQSECIDECIEFAEFLSSGDGAKIWSEYSLHFTSNADMEVDTSIPYLRDAAEYIKEGQSVSKAQVPDFSGEALTIYKTAIQKFAAEDYTEDDVDSFLAEIDDELAFIRSE